MDETLTLTGELLKLCREHDMSGFVFVCVKDGELRVYADGKSPEEEKMVERLQRDVLTAIGPGTVAHERVQAWVTARRAVGMKERRGPRHSRATGGKRGS